MDEPGVVALLVLGLGGTIVTAVLSIVAMGRGRRALAETERLRSDVNRLATTMTQLRGILVELRPLAERARELGPADPATVARAAAPASEQPAPAAAVAEAPAEKPAEKPAETPVVEKPVEPAAADKPAESAPVDKSADTAADKPAEATPATGSAAATPSSAPSDGAAVAADVIAARVAEAGAKSPPPAAAAPPKSNAGSGTLEEKIALVWFTRIGAVALLLGVAYFFKYAIDNEWIGPVGRVAAGALVGAATIGIGELTRRRALAVWSQVVTGAGLAILFLSAFASYGFYHLVPPEGAFVAFFVIAALGGALSMRHKAEAILIVAMAGALAAPPLLSTGEDRPGALFAYIFVVTSLADVVAVRMQFRWALWVGIAGAFVLFTGWYGTFFNVSAPVDYPESWGEHHHVDPGAYYAMSARAIPLLAVTAFLGQWLALFWLSREKKRLWPFAILLAAMVLAHFGYTALLYDHPVQLTVLLIVLALVSLAGLSREGKTPYLALPLFSSFLMLAGTAHAAADHQALPMLIMLTAWASIYAFGVVRGQKGGAAKLSTGTQALLGGIGMAFAIVAGVVLIKHHRMTFEMVMVALSLAYAMLSIAVDVPLVGTVAVWVSFLFVASSMPKSGNETDVAFIGVAALWAAVYGGAITWELLVKGRPATPMRVLTFSAAGLLFVLVAMVHIHESDNTLRGLLLGVVGLVDFAVGALLLRQKSRGGATAILGQALALFAAAAGALWTGATITLVWAALAAVVVWLASENRDPYWLAGGLALFFAVVIRVVGYDWPHPEQQFHLFMSTAGKEGQLMAPLFLGQRGLGLIAVGLSMLVGGRAARRTSLGATPARGFPAAGTVLVTLAHIALLALVVTEVRSHTPSVPAPPPAGVDSAEFSLFVQAYATALASAQHELEMLTTLVFALYAIVLIVIGFGFKDSVHRYLGLSLFALTLLKLALYDVWQLERIYQVLVLIAVGALLLGSGFLYARFGKRLVAVFRDGGKPAALLVAGLLLFGGRADAFDAVQLQQMRTVGGVTGPGFYRVEVDAPMYQVSQAGLGDIRLRGPDGGEVPYLVRHVPVTTPALVIAATLVDPVALPDGSVRAVLDLGKKGVRHSHIELDIDGDDFFRKTRVEVSSDEKQWALLAEGQWVYRVGGSTRTSLGYPASDSRYLRVTVLPGGQSVRAIRGATLSFAPASSEPLRRSLAVKLVRTQHDDKLKATRYVFDLGQPGLPLASLTLEVAPGRAFERRADVAAATTDGYYVGGGGGWIRRAADSSGLSSTRIDLGGGAKRFLQVTVRDGDDTPLVVTGATVDWLADELVFRAEAAGAYQLYIGGVLAPPSYDIGEVLRRAGEVQLAAASMGVLAANPDFGKGPPPPPPPFTERHKTTIAIVAGAVLALFALWAVVLLRRSKSDEGDPAP